MPGDLVMPPRPGDLQLRSALIAFGTPPTLENPPGDCTTTDEEMESSQRAEDACNKIKAPPAEDCTTTDEEVESSQQVEEGDKTEAPPAEDTAGNVAPPGDASDVTSKKRWSRKSSRLCKAKRERLNNLAERMVAMEDVELSVELQGNQFLMRKLMRKIKQTRDKQSSAEVAARPAAQIMASSPPALPPGEWLQNLPPMQLCQPLWHCDPVDTEPITRHCDPIRAPGPATSPHDGWTHITDHCDPIPVPAAATSPHDGWSHITGRWHGPNWAHRTGAHVGGWAPTTGLDRTMPEYWP